MSCNWQRAFKALYHFDRLDSTQTFLQQHDPVGAVFCRANTQTAGKGQRERTWQSPRGQLYCSFLYPVQLDYPLLQGLTQALALTLVECLDPEAKCLRVKWPNDVYLDGQKLAGLLVESRKYQQQLFLLVGLGVNLIPIAPFAGLHSMRPMEIDELLAQIMPALLACIERWQQQPYLPLNHRWADYDAFSQQKALCEHIGEVELHGIDQRGRLQVWHQKQWQFVVNTRIVQEQPCIS